MAKEVCLEARRSAREARAICSLLRLSIGKSPELRRLAHRRAATLAMLLRVYVEDERARLSRS